METPLIKLHTLDDPDPAPVELTPAEIKQQTANANTAESGDE